MMLEKLILRTDCSSGDCTLSVALIATLQPHSFFLPFELLDN